MYFGAYFDDLNEMSDIIYSLKRSFIIFINETLKKDSLGGGDIKLTFVLGFILGIKAGIVALVLSSFLALPYAIATLYLKDNHEFAYGPFIAGALFIVFFHLDKFNMLIDYVFIL